MKTIDYTSLSWVACIWCRFDLSKRTQSCSYTKSSRQSHRNPADYFLSPQETKASRSWSTYVIVCCLRHLCYLLLIVVQVPGLIMLVVKFHLGREIIITWTNWTCYFFINLLLQPAGGLLGLAGIATFVHYNDERRAVRKGTVLSFSLPTHLLFFPWIWKFHDWMLVTFRFYSYESISFMFSLMIEIQELQFVNVSRRKNLRCDLSSLGLIMN